MTTRAILRGHRADTWAELAPLLDGLRCAWADIDGWHAGGAPSAEPPGATHLWGWSQHRCVVVRLDGRWPMLSELHFSEAPPCVDAVEEIVETITHPAIGWADGHLGVTAPPSTDAFEVVEVLGLAPLSFVRVAP